MNTYRLQIRFMHDICLIDVMPKVWKQLLKVHYVSKYSSDLENGPTCKVDAKCKELYLWFMY